MADTTIAMPRALGALLALGLAVSLAPVLGAGSASAAFPGANGMIAFSRDTNGDNFPDEIYVINADGSGQTNLTNNTAVDQHPEFSADGSRIAFSRDTDGDKFPDEVFVMNADGSGQTNLTDNTAVDREPTFSPDGTKIAFRTFRNFNDEIYIMNADGSGQSGLTNNTTSEVEPAFSPDGTKIAFRSNRDGNSEIYVMNADGTGPTRLTDSVTFDIQPAYSPDGTRIAFASPRDGNDEIYVMNPNGTQTNLTNNAAFEQYPAFSPDGTKIAFTSGRDGNPEIYVMNSNGTAPTRVTNSPGIDTQADWGPVDSDDPPTAVDDEADAAENSGPGAIDVLANDIDPDGGPMVIASATDPAHGTVVLTGGAPGAHTGLTYKPDPGYCNDPEPASVEAFDYSLNGGSTATVSVTVTCTDTTVPETTITAGPDDATADSTPMFSFTSSEPDSTFECRVDAAGPFAACTSPHTTAALSDGLHTFDVRAVDASGNVDPTPASRLISVDTVAPQTEISSGPDGVTNDATPTFQFNAFEGGTTWECRVDDGAFAACPTPYTIGALSDGEHTFEVRAVDMVGNVDQTPERRTFTVDTVGPDTSITGGPDGMTNDDTPTFTFTSSDADATFECGVDGTAFTACTPPHTTDALEDGVHTFRVQAIDPLGNVDPAPAAQSFTVDTLAPDSTIAFGPTGLTTDNTPTFGWDSQGDAATYECRVDDEPFATCSSPATTAALSEGEHTFVVRATDPAGNVDESPATRSFVVDTTAPETTITSGPTGTIDHETATFGFGSIPAEASFECRIDDAPFVACTSPHTTDALANGEHTFHVRATDAAGNTDPTPAGRTFTVNLDATAPDTHIESGPAGPSNQTDPTFTFSADEPATFECKIDDGPLAPCESGDSFGPLSDGNHTFSVRATDLAGNLDPSPASRTWAVDTIAPETTITSGPSRLSLSRSATFEFTSSEAGSTFECRLDSGGWQACTSPRSFTGLRIGNHSFAVRAIDPAGNVDPTPAQRAWATFGLLLF